MQAWICAYNMCVSRLHLSQNISLAISGSAGPAQMDLLLHLSQRELELKE